MIYVGQITIKKESFICFDVSMISHVFRIHIYYPWEGNEKLHALKGVLQIICSTAASSRLIRHDATRLNGFFQNVSCKTHHSFARKHDFHINFPPENLK